MRFYLLSTVVFASFLVFAQQPQQRRIVRPIDNASAVRLRGTVAPRARADLDRGPVAAAMPMQNMSLVFNRTAAQQADLDHLLVEQHDQNSVNYHKWLTPEEFGDRFGLAEEDIKYVAGWLITQGFTVTEISRSRTWISFSGNASQVEAAFQAPIHNYVVDGVTHYAPTMEAAVPSALADVTATITGLNDFRPRPHSRARQVNPKLTSSISGNHFLVPGDFGTIYNLPDYVNGVFQPGLPDGTGQTVGIVGQTTSGGTVAVTTISSDVATFRSLSGLPPGNLNTVALDSQTQFATSEAEEAALDIEWAGAVAPNAAITFVYSSDVFNTSLRNLVNQGGATVQVISISYGDCEAHFGGQISAIEFMLAQASAQGQSVFAAAGDDGATDCDGTAQNPVATATQGLAVDYPASSQYVTGMGGTEFTGDSTATVSNGVAAPQQYWNGSNNVNDTSASALSYIPEVVWNDTSTVGSNVGTGGGVSKQFSKPSWQANDGIPASVDNNMRDVPDVALAASPNHDGYIICSQGECQTGYRRNSDQTYTVIGGTSAAAPTFAGIAALINQRLGTRQGNLNPQIYSLPASSAWVFNDVTGGDNKTVCTANSQDCPSTGGTIGYSAGTGYDLTTGWGSVDATALLDALNGTPNPHFSLLPPVASATAQAGNLNAIVAVNVVPKEGFSGTVALTCSVASSLITTTCFFDNTNVVPPASTNLVLNTSYTQAAQSGTVTVTGTSGNETESMVVNVSFTIPDYQITAGNSSETVNAGSNTTDTIAVTLVDGYTGNVNFACSGTTGLSCSLNPTTVALPGTQTTLTLSASTTAPSGSITITSTSGSLNHNLQLPVTVNATPPDFTLTVASPVVSIPSGGIITDNLTVAPVGGFSSDVSLTCNVASSLGTTTCTIIPPTVTGGNGTALVTLKGAVLSRDRRAPMPFRHHGFGEYATFVFALGMVFAGVPDRRLLNKRTLRNGLLGLLVIGLMLGAVSCGGGGGGGSSGSGPTPLTGNVTITGTSASTTHTATINVTVQ